MIWKPISTGQSLVMLPMLQLLPITADLASLTLRIVFGFAFLVHGYRKLAVDRDQTIQHMRSKGVPPFVTQLVSWIEFFGGILLMVGLMTKAIGLILAVMMVPITIFSKTRLGKKYMLGYELDLAYLAAGITLAFLGGGAISLDAALSRT